MIRKPLLLALALAAFTPAITRAASPSTLDFPQYGFTIGSLPAGPVGQGVQTLVLFLPAQDGFAPNVNVLIQPYTDTIQAYADLSRRQFAQMGFKIVKERFVGASEYVVEYTGSTAQGALHWYARAAASEGKVYLVTATARDATWTETAPALKDCVDSFALR